MHHEEKGVYVNDVPCMTKLLRKAIATRSCLNMIILNRTDESKIAFKKQRMIVVVYI